METGKSSWRGRGSAAEAANKIWSRKLLGSRLVYLQGLLGDCWRRVTLKQKVSRAPTTASPMVSFLSFSLSPSVLAFISGMASIITGCLLSRT